MQEMLRRFQQWKILMGSLLGVPPLSLRSKTSWMPSPSEEEVRQGEFWCGSESNFELLWFSISVHILVF